MINEHNHTDASTVDVEEEKQVDDSTEITPNEADETEIESDETESVPDDHQTEQMEQSDEETTDTDIVDDATQGTESAEDPPTIEPHSDTSETESEETIDTTTDESDTNETESEESTDTATDETTVPEVAAEETSHPTDPEPVSIQETQTDQVESETSDEQTDAMSQESLEEAYDNSLKAFTDGEIVKGNVVDVSRDEVMIDIGFKSEGYIPAAEFDSDENGLPTVQVGDEIDVFIVRREDSEGQIVLSKKIADQTLVWDEITQAFENGSPVDAHITDKQKGGLQVTVGTLRAFLPASQVDLRPTQDLDQYVGETFPMKIISLNKRRNNIVLSRRAWLEAEMAEKKEEVLKTLEVGQLITGVVKNITNFGAFVDLGGVDGLLHKTDMAWKRVHHPSEIVNIDDEIEVQVIAIGEENEKISLGLKQKTSDPWENVEEKYVIGSKVSGTVVNIVNYGVFVQLEEAVEGLIHVSEMAWTRRNVAPSRMVSKGTEIEAIVLEISKEEKRISLGIKQLQQNPWELLEQKYPVGTKIAGRIRNLTNFGAFVEIEEGIDGLIHTSDLSWTERTSNPQDMLKEGDEVEVVVLQIDASERRVSLGLKQTQPDPWDEVPEKYKVGSVVRGKVVNLTSFGAFTKLEEGIDGLIHISEIADRRIERPEEVVKVGDELDVKVINLDPKGRRIGLSLKAAIADQERASTPPDERQERPRRERPSRQREPKRTKPVEREETIMGALLKKEIDKNNVENLMNSQKNESPDVPEDTTVSEDTEDVEVSNDTATSENIGVSEESATSENTEVSEDTEVAEVSEDTEDAEVSEDTEDAEVSEDTEVAEVSEDTEVAEVSEDTEVAEVTEDTENADVSENPEISEESND